MVGVGAAMRKVMWMMQGDTMMVCSGLEATVQGHAYELDNVSTSTTTEQFTCT
jgi:hypothetical protein